MANLTLQYFPSAVLRQVAVAVVDPGAGAIQKLARAMGTTMLAANGIGLAAPQVGVGQRVIVVRVDDGFVSFVNPEVVDCSERQEDGEEGCLSIPGLFGLVRRPGQVKIRAVSLAGKAVTMDAEGLTARVLQHEIDHLNGVLFIDRWHQITSGAERFSELWKEYHPARH